MATEKKIETVAELTEALSRSNLTLVTDYRGLSVAELQDLRRKLREHNAELRVAKNTLTKRAAAANDLVGLDDALAGPTALVTAYDDPVQPAKVVSDFVRTSRILQIRAAMLEGSMIAVSEVEALANLPSREELIGKVVGGFVSPLYGVVGVLAGPIRSLAYVLQARVDQLGGESEAA